jgi:predicted lipid-binding transport protein (Tim44 family)
VGTGGGFPIDLILFGMIAAFLVLRLRGILGRRTGFERPADPRPLNSSRPGQDAPNLRVVPRQETRGPVIDAVAEPVTNRTLPDPASAAGQALAEMHRADDLFDTARFLDGAEGAFKLIVTAFAAGDRERLKPLLSPETYAAFDGAISAREAAGEMQRTEIRAMTSTSVESASVTGNVASITVRFVTDQINVTLGHDGQPVAGTDAVTEIVDLWTFERTLGTVDPTWRLVSARSA